jgi:hypothetical protein
MVPIVTLRFEGFTVAEAAAIETGSDANPTEDPMEPDALPERNNGKDD